ncbi:golgin subfamily A member 6-like protein 22 isoform X3 [Oncorhynchus kisutch]|uniref:golgin subfamily A member 6-like protein 22 isoform X3 n=1 Tax=Oncorhynchus kisutch TaxID=8019 RepID=UPI0012DE0D8E|nr:golgin subfamily A member 6-like protein 22 isoform X3 [Oncorhynchus kisutch]
MDLARLWGGENRGLSHVEGSDDWGDELGGLGVIPFSHSLIPLRDSSPLVLTDLDMWDSRSHFKSQSLAWSMACRTGGFLSKMSTGTSVNGRDSGFSRQSDPGLGKRRWQSMSRLAPEGAPRSLSPVSPGVELRAALEESGFRRAELVQRLREAHGRLDSQTDLLKNRETQLQHSSSTAQLLEVKHKQLADAVSALEQEKEAAELSRFEESRRRGELQDKVLRLEMDMLRMKSNLSVIKPTAPRTNNNPLSRTSPVTQQDLFREEKHRAERELSRLREALREAEERAEALETERDLQQLHTSKEAQRTVLNQTEEVNQRLGRALQTHSELQDQLSEARSKLGQATLERDLLTSKVLRLEDSVEDLKIKLTGAMSDKDRLLQDKADLHQHAQDLELQLERAQRGREGYTDQVCELSNQLAEAKAHTNRQGQETVQMKQELLTVTEMNEKMTSELEMVRQRLESSLAQLHELGAERVIHTNQIAALETERSQLIGEKQEMTSAIGRDGRQEEEVTKLRESCCQLSESQDALESENQRLHECCLTLEAELLEKEEGLCQKGEELQRLEAESAQNMEELRGVASHWSEKWQDVAMALQSTQAELEELREKNPGDTLQEEVVGRLKVEVERLQTQGQRDKEEIQTLHQHWTSKEAELSRVIKDAGSLLKVELNACKQQLELERSRTQALHNRLKVKDNAHILGRGTVETFDKGTETDIPPQARDEQVSLEELGQVSQLNSELQRLELEVAEREQHLREKEHALRSLERLRDAERTEAQIKVSTLELKLINLKEKAGGEGLCHGGQEQAQHTDSLRSQLEESRRRANQLQQERDQAVQRLQTLRRLHQATEQEAAAGSKKERMVCVDNIVNQDKQRRLVTEQLKSLFKEREQLGQVYGRSAGGGVLQDWAPKSKVIKNSLDTLHSQRKREKELMREQQQQFAGLRPVSEEQEEEDDPEREVEEEVTCLREELHSKTHAMSAMSVEISDLKERNENLQKAKLRFQPQIQGLGATASNSSEKTTSESEEPLLLERDMQRGSSSSPPPRWEDGVFLARQVQIGSPELEGEEEEDGGCG